MSELVELDGALRLSLGVRLVDGEDDGLAAGSQYVGDVYIRAGNALCDVSDHYHDVGVFDGRLDLGADLSPHIGIGEDFETAGINEDERVVGPHGLEHHPVAGGAGLFGDDCDGPAYQPVEQGGFADVWASDDGYYWLWHGSVSPPARVVGGMLPDLGARLQWQVWRRGFI